MMAAFTSDRDVVSRADVESAVEELRWKEYHERTRSVSEAGSDATVATGRFGTRRGPGLYVGPEESGHVEQDAPPPVAKLVVVTEGRTVGELPLLVGRTVIGRTPDNDLQIDSRFVSRHHCQIVTKADSCLVEDLNSTNGIVIKSRRVRRHNLNDGDVISIGKHDLIYVDQRSDRSGGTGGHSAMVASPQEDETPGPADEADHPAHGTTQRL
jgi:hypothetical protein